jgi:predicted hotdog family 3-hydroxylacyl-ACP dehydratase
MLNRSWIEARIPHKGTMCLLDGVDSHDEHEIVCSALSHRSPDNPLRDEAGLGIAAGIEYAAQAMAVHGALRDGHSAACGGGGYLVSARDVTWSVQRLDSFTGPLSIRAQRLSGTATNVMYRFSLHADCHEVLSGRATVILDAAGVAPSTASNPQARPS